MEQETQVLEYKCPSCGGGLHFGEDNQRMQCPYCESQFDIEDVLSYNIQLGASQEPEFQWDESQSAQLSDEDQESLKSFVCPS